MGSRQKKRLTRSASNRMIAGVMGGLGDYFEINANYLRVAFVILAVLLRGFPGILVYLLLAILMPADPNKTSWTSFFSNFGNHQSTPDKGQSGRKVLHDVDENDDKEDK